MPTQLSMTVSDAGLWPDGAAQLISDKRLTLMASQLSTDWCEAYHGYCDLYPLPPTHTLLKIPQQQVCDKGGLKLPRPQKAGNLGRKDGHWTDKQN